MKLGPNDIQLEDLIHRAIGRDGVPFDFQQWEQRHRTRVEQFRARTASKEISCPDKAGILDLILGSCAVKLAVAVVFLLATLVAFCYLVVSFDAAAPVYAVTDVPEVLARAVTLHASGWRYFPGHTMPDGSPIPPVPIELWADLVNRRDRQSTASLTSGKEFVDIRVGEVIRDSQYLLRLDHTEKTASFYRSARPDQAEQRSETADRWVRLLLGDFTDLASSVKIGEEEVDGQWCEVWEWERMHQVSGAGQRTRFWFSPATGQMRRVQSWMKWNHTDWRLTEEYTRIELDLPIPEAVFAVEVPAGYEATNTKETPASSASHAPSVGGYADDKCSLSHGVAPSFTLRDGSVIWGWWSIDEMSQVPREAYFADLTFGGPLPKLPIEFDALVPGGRPSQVVYRGYHLTHTCKSYVDKGQILTEWALYVPEGSPPDSVEEYDYDAQYVFNLDHTPRLQIGLPVPYGRCIRTAEDFDRWVLAAIAETSDGDGFPEQLTFDRVIQLAEHVRQSQTTRDVQGQP